ncbi:hypothetical protein N7493_001453 [Penicillium malachiteum]|uniref:Uncharacterized protein n=1 Tax=Penicillium malachiteum TaxID=1324776 RepID=A0AAD6HUM3_9EURO|nr:hypothetical protein N7493_001453 [Penicillium malachiteum]
MYWRSFRQAGIWHIYLRLLAKELVNVESLILPIDLLESSTHSHRISRLFGCFEFFAAQSEEAFLGKIPGQTDAWTVDTMVIVRSGADIDSILAEVKKSEILGKLRYDKIARWRADYPEYDTVHDAEDRVGTISDDGQVAIHNNTFAFWLPQGLTDNLQTQNERLLRCRSRAQAIEMAFMQVETLPVGILIIDLRVFGFGSESGAALEDDTVGIHSGEGKDHNHEKDKPGESDDYADDHNPYTDGPDEDNSSSENDLFDESENFDELWWLVSDY